MCNAVYKQRISETNRAQLMVAVLLFIIYVPGASVYYIVY